MGCLFATANLDITPLSDHPTMFSEDLGCYIGSPVKLSLNKDAQPTFCKARPVPFALCSKVEDKNHGWWVGFQKYKEEITNQMQETSVSVPSGQPVFNSHYRPTSLVITPH